MLILTRRPGESIAIGEDVTVTVVTVNGNHVRLGISAPRSVQVVREEIYDAMQDGNHTVPRNVNSKKSLNGAGGHIGGKKVKAHR